MRSHAVTAFLAVWWIARVCPAAPPPRPPGPVEGKPRPASETARIEAVPERHGCTLEAEGGPRGGLTVNDDQWVAGGHLRLGFLCLGGFAFESVGLVGFGGNYLTLRPSLRAIYRLYSDTNRELEIHPTIGVSVVQWFPVGPFSTWCERFEVDACWARDSGVELGGGVAYRFLGLEAVAGFGSLPVVTVTLLANFPIAKGGW